MNVGSQRPLVNTEQHVRMVMHKKIGKSRRSGYIWLLDSIKKEREREGMSKRAGSLRKRERQQRVIG